MKKILILAGGYSKEKEVSIKTAKSVYSELNKDRKYKIKVVNPDGKFVQVLRNFNPNIVLNLLHGRYGEDGYIQAILESEKVKYTHSGVLSSSLAIDKELSKKIFIKHKILTPKYLKFSYRNNINKLKLINYLQKKIGFPLVVKPLNEGSSVNVFICNKNNILKTLTKLNEYGEVLLEKYIPGREIQVAILENKVLGAIELRPTRKFYDYQAKYNPKARTEHIIPVEISKRKYQELTKIALKAHKILNCRGVTRSDFRYYKNSFYLLETNTQPGMTSLSLVPEIANFNNITFKNLIKKILKDASINK
ncbi:D-alanine--D-alanine ligase [Pelagibacteraceae bacterium GOM-A1]|nr:D-alanine--D-alanine ligase [Pelagibacteraceae bacterium GOM-A1]